ncbi:hypothetical protein KAU33_08715 [Candidatus Dependentiae bacterium]|nr:hypothetical protein [Candidatus Dependentiae bacterium]
MQEIMIKDPQLIELFGIEVLGITEDNGRIILNLFGNGHRSIELETKPLANVGSGSIMTQDVFDARVKHFEDLE